MSQIETKQFTKRCEAKTSSGRQCKCYAVAAVCVRKGQLLQYSPDADKAIGRGVGSQWITVCNQHARNFPDYDGFVIEGVRRPI
jgi:hypothetical protein